MPAHLQLRLRRYVPYGLFYGTKWHIKKALIAIYN